MAFKLLRGQEQGAALMVTMMFLVLISWSTFLYAFYSSVPDLKSVELDSLCQSVSRAVAYEFPSAVGGFEGLDPAAFAASDPVSATGALGSLAKNIDERIKSSLRLHNQSSARSFALMNDAATRSNITSAANAAVSASTIIYAFAPINNRVAATNEFHRWNTGVRLRLAQLTTPSFGTKFWGSTFGTATGTAGEGRITKVECTAEIRPADILLVQDTSEGVGRWTKAGDGGPFQKLCTEAGKRYERYSAGQTQTAGVGGPDEDAFSLCFRVCVAGVDPSTGAPSGPPPANPNMLLAGPAGRQSQDASSRPIASSNMLHPVAAYRTPYQGQRVVCHTAHSAPELAHMMLTAASLGKSLYCAHDPADTAKSGIGYHPMCQTGNSFAGGCADGSSGECDAAVSTTSATSIVPPPADMVIGERTVIRYITEGLPAAQDPNLEGGPHDLDSAITVLGGVRDLIAVARAYEQQADAAYTSGAQSKIIQERHYLAWTHFLKALDSMRDARHCMDPLVLGLRMATLQGIAFLEGGDPRCDIDGGDNCYKGKYFVGSAAQDNVPLNWSSSLYRVAVAHYNHLFRFSHGDIRRGFGGKMFTPEMKHSRQYQRPLEPGAMTRPVVLQNKSYGCEMWAREARFHAAGEVSPGLAVDYAGAVDLTGSGTNPTGGNSYDYSGDSMWPPLKAGSQDDLLPPLVGGLKLPYQSSGGVAFPGWSAPVAPAAALKLASLGGGKKTFGSGPATAASTERTAARTLVAEPAEETETVTEAGAADDPEITFVGPITDTELVGLTTFPSIIQEITLSTPGSFSATNPFKALATWYPDSPITGALQVGLSSDPKEPQTDCASSTAGTTKEFDFDPTKPYYSCAKNLNHFTMGWWPNGYRYSMSALHLAGLGMAASPRRQGSLVMSAQSLPEKIIVFNAFGLPSDLECLQRKSGVAPEDFDYWSLSPDEKTNYCRDCWNDVVSLYDKAWRGEDVLGLETDTNYERRMMVYMNLLLDERTENEYCGEFNLVTAAREAVEVDQKPWIYVNLFSSPMEMIDAQNMYVFTRSVLRSR